MILKENNFAYIDGANLHKGIKSLGWILDYKKFRIWLTEKYKVNRAYLFLGMIPKYKELYQYLQECGFMLIFKEVVYNDAGMPKGNCDADLVLQAVKDTYENKFDKSILVSSDGDYSCLVSFLMEKQKFLSLLSPHPKDKCSILLKRTNAKIVYINDKRRGLEKLNLKEKAPDKDETL